MRENLVELAADTTQLSFPIKTTRVLPDKTRKSTHLITIEGMGLVLFCLCTRISRDTPKTVTKNTSKWINSKVSDIDKSSCSWNILAKKLRSLVGTKMPRFSVPDI